MIRAVLDTNLVVNYLLTRGTTLARILDHWEQEHFVYLLSPAMLSELKTVVVRPRLRRAMKADPQDLLAVIEADAELILGQQRLTGVCRDPKDDIFIACAVEAEADYLVTGDNDLLSLGQYSNVQIVRPAEFLRILDTLEV